MKYIALLRGINVGGNNKIAMSELKAAFEKSGFYEVSTYINSGNVFFSSEITDILVFQKKCSEIILKEFGLNIIVSVVLATELISALENAPDWWDNDENSKHNAIFVIPPQTVEAIMKDIGEIKPEYEKLDSAGNVIFWSAPLDTFSRTRLSKIVSTTLYSSVTIRNANTAKKLSKLLKD